VYGGIYFRNIEVEGVKLRVFILLGRSTTSFERRVLEPFLRSTNIKICGALIDNRTPDSAFQRFRKNIRKGRGWYTVIMALQVLYHLIFRTNQLKDTARYLAENRITYFKSEEPYSNETTNKIITFNPDVLLLIGGFGIIREPLLSLCRYGVLSYHHGDMRKYRGQPPCLWELYNGENEMKVTVQRLNNGLDCGQPITEKTISIYQNDTLRTLQKRAFDESVNMAYGACELLLDPNFKPARITNFGEIYTIPNLRQWIRLVCKTIIKSRFPERKHD
jgi:folate-dependent phosphoribosylglycinamide formyltransferase PurN